METDRCIRGCPYDVHTHGFLSVSVHGQRIITKAPKHAETFDNYHALCLTNDSLHLSSSVAFLYNKKIPYHYNGLQKNTIATTYGSSSSGFAEEIKKLCASMASKQVLVVIVVVTVATILAAPAPALAVDLLVGDSQGWRLDVNYNDWVDGNDFIVGDTLGSYVNFEHN